MTESFESWASHQLSLLLGLSEADIQEQTLPYLVSLSESELAEALPNFLGLEHMAVVEEFMARRFPTVAPTVPVPVVPTKQYTTAGMSYASASFRAPSPPPPRAASPSPPSSSAVPSDQMAAPSMAPSPPKSGKKKKGSTGMTMAQFEALERQGKLSKDRVECGCQATAHNLLTNCLTCGRIVCAAEGPGACYTCQTPVLSSAQQLESLATRAAEAAAEAFMADAPLDLSRLSSTAALAVAQENQARLLEYDATSAQRTTVVDVKADFIAYDGAGSLWLSDSERARAARKDAAIRNSMASKSMAPSKARGMVFDLDLERGAVVEAAAPISAVVDDEEDEGGDDNGDHEDRADSAAAAYAWSAPGMGDGRPLVRSGGMAAAPALVATGGKRSASKAATAATVGEGSGAYVHAGLTERPLYVDYAALEKARLAKEAAEAGAGKGKRKKQQVKMPPVGTGTSASLEDDPGCG
ncbi:putative zinc finger motif, C2HC5-type-domain-containing protein [Blastocladiella britannica]|nr:putative zinc finger motif, C2HC5-type-domain-containing protein [Blastocladiella britannica]